MDYRRLGTSGFEVSALSFGGWQMGDPSYWGDDARADYDAAVHAAIDAGINLFDTAEMYGAGKSEEALGRALKGKRDAVLIASKALPGNCSSEKLRGACEASLARLGTDRIDLYQIHWPCREVPFAETWETMMALQREGKIREIGVSNFGVADLDAWLKCGPCVSDQLGYNLAFRAVEHEIVPACVKHSVGILAYMPLLQGVLSYRWKSAGDIPQSRRRTRHFSCDRPGVNHGEPGCEELLFSTLSQLDAVAQDLGQPVASLSLAWLMAQPEITTVIIGARNSSQLARNMSAVDLRLDAATLRKVDQITGPLKDYFGLNADMWWGGDRSRIR